MNFNRVLSLLERNIVITEFGETKCHECGAKGGDELQHDQGCEYVEAVKFIGRVDPRSRMERGA